MTVCPTVAATNPFTAPSAKWGPLILVTGGSPYAEQLIVHVFPSARVGRAFNKEYPPPPMMLVQAIRTVFPGAIRGSYKFLPRVFARNVAVASGQLAHTTQAPQPRRRSVSAPFADAFDVALSYAPRVHRILVLGGGLPGYFELPEDEKERVFGPAFRSLLSDWETAGARVVASFCDDVLQVGPAEPGHWAWYLIFEVESLDVVAAMMNRVRSDIDGVRLDAYVRFEVRIGRPFWAREEASGSS